MRNHTNRLYSILPSDPDMINDRMCGPYNRKGVLCGECIDGYGPAVYSYDLKCANCSQLSSGYAISLYLFLEFIPSTLFFICVTVFHVNITSGPLLGYVLFCQMYAYAFKMLDLYIYEYMHSTLSPFLRALFNISIALCDFWNLNFLRPLLPAFCISEKLTVIHIQILNVVTAIYPIVLVIITCILMELHARNVRLIHIVWKPFHIILNKLHVTTINSDAVLHAFASFIFLSSTTNAFRVFVLFHETKMYSNIVNYTIQSTVYIDPTINYFSNQHIIYLLISLITTVVLVLIPSLLLCIYPTRIYRSFSRVINARKRLAITAFAEALHNGFKDGLNGTRDYRSSAGLVIFGTAFYGLITSTVHNILSVYVGLFISVSTFFVLSLLVSYIRPCKSTIANFSLSYHLMMFGILVMGGYLWMNNLPADTESLELTFIVVPVISHVLVFLWIEYTLTQHIWNYFKINYDSCCLMVAVNRLTVAVRAKLNRRQCDYQVLTTVQ